VSALAFGGLLLIPTNFSYPEFAILIFVAGAGMGLFSAPNAAGIMNSVPAGQRGAASGMLATFQNSGFVLSIGIFFSLMIAGLASTLPTTLTRGLTGQGVPSAIAHQIGSLPPVGSLFAAFLGYNPIQELLKPTGALAKLPPANAARLTGKSFFPQLISQPFHHGLVIVFAMAIAVLVIAAATSLLRGGRYVHDEHAAAATVAAATATEGAGTDVVADEVAAEAADDADRAVAGSNGTAGESANGAARGSAAAGNGAGANDAGANGAGANGAGANGAGANGAGAENGRRAVRAGKGRATPDA